MLGMKEERNTRVAQERKMSYQCETKGDLSLLPIDTEADLEERFIVDYNDASLKKKNKRKCCGGQKFQLKLKQKEISKSIKKRIPFVDWIPKYNWKDNFMVDLVAGINVACIIAPKALGHALLAGVHPIQGIYTAFWGSLVYGLFGTSPWLSLGTGALQSILFGEALEKVVSSESSTVTVGEVSIMLTFFVAMLTIVMGLCRAEKVLVLLSPAALNAFIVGGAFLILASQLKYFTGLHIDAPDVGSFPVTIVELLGKIGSWNFPTFALGMVSIVFLLCSKFATKKLGIPDPGGLLLVIFSIITSSQLGLNENYDVAIVGSQPQGFPPFALPWSNIPNSGSASLYLNLLLNALPLAIINLLLMLALSKSMAAKSKTEASHRLDQEVFALAGANLAGSFFGGIVSAASFSASAIISSSKARSLLVNIPNALVLLVIMTTLAETLGDLPKVTLSSIIVVALPRLMDFSFPFDLAKVKRQDAALWVVSFLTTLFTNITIGIGAAFGLSILVLAWRSAHVHTAELGRLPRTEIYRSLANFQDAQRVIGVKIFRIDTSVNFCNSDYVSSLLSKFLDAIDDSEHVLIVSCEGINDIDYAGIEMLRKFCQGAAARDKTVFFAGLKKEARTTLMKARQVKLKNDPAQELEAILDPSKWYLSIHGITTKHCNP